MRRITRPAAATVLVVGLFAGTIGVTAGSASATAPAGSQAAYCQELLKIQSSAPKTPADLATLSKQLTKIAKSAPTSALKKALLLIAAYEAGLAKGKKPQTAKSAPVLAKAFKAASVSAAKCSASAVPKTGAGTSPTPGG